MRVPLDSASAEYSQRSHSEPAATAASAAMTPASSHHRRRCATRPVPGPVLAAGPPSTAVTSALSVNQARARVRTVRTLDQRFDIHQSPLTARFRCLRHGTATDASTPADVTDIGSARDSRHDRMVLLSPRRVGHDGLVNRPDPLRSPLAGSVEPDRTVVRAGYMWWVLATCGVGLNLFFMLAFGLQNASTVDRIGTAVIGGTLAAAVVAVATSRIVLRGNKLLAVGTVLITEVEAQHVADVDDENGLAVVLSSGRHIELGIAQPSLAQRLLRNRRRRHEAAEIRAWASARRQMSEPAWEPTRCRVRPRWVVVAAVPTWAASSAALALMLHAVAGP